MEITKKSLEAQFLKTFNKEPEQYFISPGRLEIIGNHTDHNHGLAIVASASLYIKAAVAYRDDGIINLNSNGSEFYNIPTSEGEPQEDEFMSSRGLIRGVVNGFIKYGYKVGGFDCFCNSEVPSGSGVSSSAAFELLICAILNGLYNDNKVDKVTMAKISQASEREYFGKPCGILDQIGAACGGISYVDFFDPSNPEVKNASFPFNLRIVLTNPGGSHAGLTSYYASIPNDMFAVAHKFNKEVLREVSVKEYLEYKVAHPEGLSESEKNRADHYFSECSRVEKTYSAITNNNKQEFIKMINASGYSSSNILRNTCVPGKYAHSPERALRIARKYAPSGAHRVHGGGFMGTIISFIDERDYPRFKRIMNKTFGEGSVIDVSISPFGAGEYK